MPRTSANDNSKWKFISYLRLAHGGFELVAGFAATGKHASLDPGASADGKSFLGLHRAEIRSHTAGAVSGNFRFRSVGIEEPRLHIRIRRGIQPLDAVSSHTGMAIADAPAEIRDVVRQRPSHQ